MRFVLAASAVAFFLASSCARAQAPVPKIKKAYIGGASLTLEFDEPMLTWNTSAQNTAVRVEPALPCEWYWESDTTLACDGPAMRRAVKAATAYRLVVAGPLYSQAGVALPPTTQVIETERAELYLEGLEWHDGVPSFEVSASNPVTAEAVAAVLRLHLDGEDVPYSLAPRVVRGSTRFRVVAPALAGRFGVLVVEVRPGLRTTEGPLPGTEAKELRRLRVGEPFRLRRINCTLAKANPKDSGFYTVRADPLAIGPCSPDASINLTFSRTLSDAALAALKAALPAGWTATTGEPSRGLDSDLEEDKKVTAAGGSYLYLKATAAQAAVPLVLPPSMTSRDGAPLAPAPSITLSTGDHAPGLGIAPLVLRLAPGDEAMPVATQRNLAKATVFERLAIGGRTHRDRTKLAASPTRNVGRVAPVAPAPADVREHGGLLLAGMRTSYVTHYAVAYAPFDVVVRPTDDQGRRTLVWASRWGEAQGLADAQVELLHLDAKGRETIEATARTDADGVAWLDAVPDPNEHGFKLGRLVRVTHGGQRTVLPLSGNALDLPDHENESYGMDDDLQFGVTDRVLYRPGETVRYRVWWRAREGNHLVPRGAPEKLELSSPDTYKVLRDWPVVADALGGMAGEIELPAQLEDGTYCIGEEDTEAGACFHVARFDAQPMWSTLVADRALVRAGDAVSFDAEAGYFSGGAAPGATLDFRGLLMPVAFGTTYPEFAAYEFTGSSRTHGVDALRGHAAPPGATDAHGRAHWRFIVPNYVGEDDDDHASDIAFGRLEVTVGVSGAGRATARSAPVAMAYTAYPRFVGLRADGWWLAQDRDVPLASVVVTSDGKAVPGVPVEVRIESAGGGWLEGDDDPDVAVEVVGRCKIVAGASDPCAFRAPTPGWYRFVASAADAAPTRLVRWIGGAAPKDEDEALTAELSLVHAGDGATPARVRLRQPYAAALALFVVEYGSVRQHWVQRVEAGDTELDVPLRTEWAPGVTLRAVVRRADGDASAFTTRTLGAALDLAIPRPDVALRVELAPSPAKPGQEIVVRLRNPTDTARQATVALVDDAIHQQASEFWGFFDPDADSWLGALDEWTIGDWHSLETYVPRKNAFYDKEVRIQSQTVTASSPVVELQPEEFQYSGTYSGGDGLDTVVVTGTRINAEDVFDRGARVQPLRSGPRTGTGQALARVRQRFLDTAYWNPGVPVPAGSVVELKVPLPDNLTRWRALVWTSDAGDGFALSEATVPSTLPVELRLGVPARLFPGDVSLATAAARNHTSGAASIAMTLEVEGAGTRVSKSASARVGAEAELTERATLAPTAPGELVLVSRGDSPVGADAVAASVPVQSRRMADRLTQVGWIDAEPMSLRLPELPEGALPLALDVEVRRGAGGWLDGWLADLRDYPHRCWEQSITRALGAAIAVQAGRTTLWPDAAALVDKTLVNAPAFQGDDGRMHFWLTEGEWSGRGDPLLSAWTLRAFDELRALGHVPPKRVYADLVAAVAKDAVAPDDEGKDKDTSRDHAWEVAAVAAGAVAGPRDGPDEDVDTDDEDEDARGGRTVGTDSLGRIWQHWDRLSWHARGELVRALSRQPDLAAEFAEAIARLRAAGEVHGLRQVVRDPRDFGYAMGSNLRDQCAVVDALFTYDADPAGEARRAALLRGVADLYAGDTASLDTQASIRCVLAMRVAAKRLPAGSAEARAVDIALGAAQATLSSADERIPARWSTPGPFDADALTLRGPAVVDPTLNYAATVRYEIDALAAPARAVGLRLERRYSVLRAGKWIDVPAAGVNEGDWVRVTLRVTVPAWRHFVAITDPVPGGLVTRDLALAGVGDASLRAASDPGSWWFDQRQTGATEMRLYAEQLPPGTHEVHYFAQAVHPGDYLAPPAVAELMYGRGSRATTRGVMLEVVGQSQR
jgi:uncharacterized protein YfaS (alpha-2-macroglobulin family)